MENYNSFLKGKFAAKNEKKEEIKKEVMKENITPNDNEQDLIDSVIKTVSNIFAEEIAAHNIDSVKENIEKTASELIEKLEVPYKTKQRVKKVVLNTIIGFGPLTKYLNDPSVTEIVVQKYNNICIERNGVIRPIREQFVSEEALVNTIQRMIGEINRTLTITSPAVDGRLKDGSRINATIPPITPKGATLTIRKFSDKVIDGDTYVEIGSLNNEMLEFLKACVRAKVSIIVSGGTGAGKTTLLNMLSAYIPENELIVTIEDSLELKLQQRNVRQMETRPTKEGDTLDNADTAFCVKNSLRMRPDRIILGETRGGEVVDLLSALSTGHEGSLSTIHANSPLNLVNTRIPILFSKDKESNFSSEDIARQISESIELIVQISRVENKRYITKITQVTGLNEKGDVKLDDIFVFDRLTTSFQKTGYIPEKILAKINEKRIAYKFLSKYNKNADVELVKEGIEYKECKKGEENE